VRIAPAGRITGTLEPPPDKSISHRALLLGAMAEGETRLRGVLRAADTDSTLAAVRALGAQVAEHESHGTGIDLVLRGRGLRGVRDVAGPIDVGNAGTLLRLLPGWLAGQGKGEWTLDGDASIRRRPVDRVADPLRRMGARVECREGRLPPIVVKGAELEGICFELPVASAQVKSCVLLAGLLARGETIVVERVASRDHTERMLVAAGAPLESRDGRITVSEVDRLELGEVVVPGDLSSAAFALVAATLVPGSALRLRNVGVNPTRMGLLGVLTRMGANVAVEDRRMVGYEPVAELVVGHASLAATTVRPHEVPLLIDELPLVALLGAFAEGTTVVEGAEELKHKESDRIATVVDGLRALGASIEARPDGFAVEGAGALRGGRIDAAGDHRLAMLGAVAGLASSEGVELRGAEAANVSYPRFFEDLASVTGGDH
jgi:3-phosphoshikimate 1-carboxyvinyltransferase